MCKELVQGCTRQPGGWDSNPRSQVPSHSVAEPHMGGGYEITELKALISFQRYNCCRVMVTSKGRLLPVVF